MKRRMATWLVSALVLSCGGSGAASRTPVPAPKQYVEPPQQAGGVQLISGEVLGVDRVSAADQNSLTLSVRVSPGGKDIVKVDLGPGWYFDEKGITFSPNEQIVVRGSHEHVHGEPKLVARELEKDGETYQRDPQDPKGAWKKEGDGHEQGAEESAPPQETPPAADGAPAPQAPAP